MNQLERIRSSTLVLVGDQDMQDILAISVILSRKIPDAKRKVIPGTAHMLNLEKPVLFNQAIKTFLDLN